MRKLTMKERFYYPLLNVKQALIDYALRSLLTYYVRHNGYRELVFQHERATGRQGVKELFQHTLGLNISYRGASEVIVDLAESCLDNCAFEDQGKHWHKTLWNLLVVKKANHCE